MSRGVARRIEDVEAAVGEEIVGAEAGDLKGAAAGAAARVEGDLVRLAALVVGFEDRGGEVGGVAWEEGGFEAWADVEVCGWGEEGGGAGVVAVVVAGVWLYFLSLMGGYICERGI